MDRTGRATALRVSDHVAHLILCGPLPIRSGEVLARNQYGLPMFGFRDRAGTLQFAVDQPVDLDAQSIVRRNDKCVRRLRVVCGDRSHPVLWIAEFMHPPLLIKIGDRFSHFPARELLNDFPGALGLSV